MIKDRINKLAKEDKRQLYYAFEHQFSQIVKLSDNKFIGVNVKINKNLKILNSAGAWSYGEYINESNTT